MVQVEKLQQQRKLVRQVLTQYAQLATLPSGTDSVVVADEASDNYLLLDVGWEGAERAHYVIAHLRLRAGQVLIEKDGIEHGIAQDLQAAGIPPTDIVTAWRRYPESVITERAAA